MHYNYRIITGSRNPSGPWVTAQPLEENVSVDVEVMPDA